MYKELKALWPVAANSVLVSLTRQWINGRLFEPYQVVFCGDKAPVMPLAENVLNDLEKSRRSTNWSLIGAKKFIEDLDNVTFFSEEVEQKTVTLDQALTHYMRLYVELTLADFAHGAEILISNRTHKDGFPYFFERYFGQLVLNESDKDQIFKLVSKGRRQNTKKEIQSSLDAIQHYPAVLDDIPHSILSCMCLRNNHWQFFAGQSYPDEISRFVKLLIS